MALSVYMGHASMTVTLDRYGHLFPGNGDEAAGLLDAYLGAAVRQSHTGSAGSSGGLGRTSSRKSRSPEAAQMQVARASATTRMRCPRQESNLRHQV
jgi:hypothetical protein